MHCLQLYIPLKVQTINLESYIPNGYSWRQIAPRFPRLNNCNCGPKEIKQF